MGTQETTAQVHPFKLTTAFADSAKEKGAKVIKETVEKVLYNEDGDKQVEPNSIRHR